MRKAHGQSMAEFAIVFPIFILLVLAIFDMGRFVVTQNSLTNASREGTRLAAVNQDAASIAQRVETMVFLGEPVVAPTIFLQAPPDPADTNLDDNPRCGPGESRPLSVGCVAVVRVTSTMTPITPVVGSVIGEMTLSAAALQPIEFVCPNGGIVGLQTVGNCPKQP